MGADIYIPVLLLAIAVPVVSFWAKRRFKDTSDDDSALVVPPGDRLTSTALRRLESPPWRVVYEVAHERLNGVGHVLIGPAGVFALQTTMDPVPAAPSSEPDARAIGQAAVARGGVDDALRRCNMSSTALVDVHWGVNEGADIAVELMPGRIAIDGRSLVDWADGTRDDALSAAQVDLAWQTIVTAIGRPDPLA